MSNEGRLWSDSDRHEVPAPRQAMRRAPDKNDEEAADPPLVFPDDRVYVPYNTRSRPATLALFCAKLPVQFPTYVQLENMSFEHHFGETFTLFYPFMTVRVTGHRLEQVVYYINARKCAIIREWDRDLYDPPERGISVIEKIEFGPPAAQLSSGRGEGL
jgi:hypothetical protein